MKHALKLHLLGASICALCLAQTVPAKGLSPAAQAYVREVIDAFETQHLNSERIDWEKLSADAYANAGDAQSPADVYPTVRFIIDRIGEKHTSFFTADQARAIATGSRTGSASPPPVHWPEAELLQDGPGIVRLSTLIASAETARLYSMRSRALLQDLERRGACGYVIDLRSNAGGNMWAMLNGLTGLFTDGTLGAFENSKGERSAWIRANGHIYLEGNTPEPGDNAVLARQDAPVAILLSENTKSSGEFTALALRGRTRSRSFGQVTAGFVTANHPVILSDGAQINMTSLRTLDRTGAIQTGSIVPDEQTDRGGPTLDAALRWLAMQGCGSVDSVSHRPD